MEKCLRGLDHTYPSVVAEYVELMTLALRYGQVLNIAGQEFVQYLKVCGNWRRKL
jgi:hypothetical protein